MNLYLRLIWVLIGAIFRQPISLKNAHVSLRLRVLPNDIDVAGHMNNGRYLTICDLTRVELFQRTGLLKHMFKHGWIPLIAHHTMTYKKPLKLFALYDVSMNIVKWDDKYFHCKHTFMQGDKLIAEGESLGVLRAQNGVLAPADVIDILES